jgi:hypothetical protein
MNQTLLKGGQKQVAKIKRGAENKNRYGFCLTVIIKN